MTKITCLPKVIAENTSYVMKPISEQILSGQLTTQAKEELLGMKLSEDADQKDAAINEETSVIALREAMGWHKANHKNEHELIIVNQIMNGVNVRVYTQKSLANQELPVILFIHGGGFFGGSLDNVEYPCQYLADQGAVRVISIDYGLAPENPYPRDLLDCYQVLVYVHNHKQELLINDDSITVMGDSAGGNLTYALALLDCQLGSNYLTSCVALYPVTYQGKRQDLQNYFGNPQNLNLKQDAKMIATYINNFGESMPLIDDWYIHGADPESMYISPLTAPESLLAKLPRTLFIVGEFDPLRLQGEAFYHKMKLAGGDITYIRYNGMIHAFMDKVGDFPQADDALAEALNFILN